LTWTVRKFGISECAIYRSWFDDPELARRISITPTWFEYVTQTPGVTAWMIFRDQMPVAVIQFEEQPYPSLDIAINPVLRGQGLCASMIRLVLDLPELRRFDKIFGAIEPDNFASLNCVLKAGFYRTSGGLDEDGLIEVVFSRASPDTTVP
jgi:RimJ/RimL family protein N-acetyltransferase